MTKKDQPLSHELVPPHKILSADEKKKVLQKFGIREDMLPRIYANDPALSGMGANIGDVIRISRNEGTGESDYYRIVVKA